MDPRYLVDTATRAGMSGSPVFEVSPGFSVPHSYQIDHEDPLQNVSELSRAYETGDIEDIKILQFCGVYSGAVVNDRHRDFQLGYVIHRRAVGQLIEAPVGGINHFPP